MMPAQETVTGLQQQLDAQQTELEHLRALVAGYECGRFIRLMRWLHHIRQK